MKRIIFFVFEVVDKFVEGEEKEFSLGVYVKIKLGKGFVRVYFIVDGDKEWFQLVVVFEEKSCGGSKYFYYEVKVGDVL